MNITIDLPNLDGMIKEITSTNIENTINKVIYDKVESYITQDIKTLIEEAVTKSVENYVIDFMKNYKITIGGGLTGEEVKEMSVESYIKQQIAKKMETKAFIIEKKDNWGDIRKTEVSFDTYVKTHFDVSKEIETYLSSYTKSLQNTVTKDIKRIFDECTKKALSETVFDMLMKTDTYQNINNSIKMLGQNGV